MLCEICPTRQICKLVHDVTAMCCPADPHGMFQLKDTVHVFFQYNPRALAWGELKKAARPLRVKALGGAVGCSQPQIAGCC